MRTYQNNQRQQYINPSNKYGVTTKKTKTVDSKKLTQDFFDTFIQTCVLAQWRYQIIARKYQKRNNRKPTQKDIYLVNTKKLLNVIANIYAEHVANYLYDLCDIILQMPEKPGIKHDRYFGTIKIINNNTLNIKAMRRIRFLSKLYFIIRINSNLEDILIESINKMRENRQRKGN